MRILELTNNNVRSKLDFGSDLSASAHRRSAPPMRESGNWTRNSGACGEKERELGDDNFLSRTEIFFQKSDFRASAGSNYLPEASFGGMEGGTSGGSRGKGLIPERGSSKTTQNGTPSDNQMRRPVDESGESDKPKLKLESLIKQLGTKLKSVEGFEVWKKGVKDIGKYRRWPASFTETHKADELEKINRNENMDAREEGYFVMKSTISSEFHYLFDSIDYHCFEEM